MDPIADAMRFVGLQLISSAPIQKRCPLCAEEQWFVQDKWLNHLRSVHLFNLAMVNERDSTTAHQLLQQEYPGCLSTRTSPVCAVCQTPDAVFFTDEQQWKHWKRNHHDTSFENCFPPWETIFHAASINARRA